MLIKDKVLQPQKQYKTKAISLRNKQKTHKFKTHHVGKESVFQKRCFFFLLGTSRYLNASCKTFCLNLFFFCPDPCYYIDKSLKVEKARVDQITQFFCALISK